MTQPTLVAFTKSTSFTSGTNRNVAASITWLTGDEIYILGGTEDQARTLNTPTVTGLTFSLVDSNAADSDCRTYYWKATAASGGSGTVACTLSNSGLYGGICLWQYRATGGSGTAVKATNSGNRTLSVTRAAGDSHVLFIAADWSANTDVTITGDPATDSTQRHAQNVSGAATIIAYSWINQGATGTLSYGYGSQTGTVDNSMIAVEIKGTASSGAIVGSSTLTFGQSGVLAGSGALVGSSALTFGQTGVATGSGALAGSSTLTFTQAGALTGAGGMTASASLTFSQAGALTGSGAMQGTSLLTFGQTATLTADGALSASASLVFTPSGTLVSGAGAISGTAGLIFTGAGTLTGSGAMAGSSPLVFGGAGTLSADAALAGSSSIVFTQSGVLTGTAALIGSASFAFGATGGIAASGKLVGATNLTFFATATIGGGGPVWPAESDVRFGIQYGPTGGEYTGSLVGGGGSFMRRR